MKTGLTRKQQVTEFYFNEHDDLAEIHPHNMKLKMRRVACTMTPKLPSTTLKTAFTLAEFDHHQSQQICFAPANLGQHPLPQ